MTQMTLIKRLGQAMGGEKLGTLYRSIFPAADKLNGEKGDRLASDKAKDVFNGLLVGLFGLVIHPVAAADAAAIKKITGKDE